MEKPIAEGQCLGAYEIVRQLDAGGMGMVYEAVHTTLGTHCAIKVFVTQSERRQYLRDHFDAEGKLLAEFRHPNIVRVTDMQVDKASGAPYFVMDLILSPNGKPMTLEAARQSGVDEDQVVGWLRDICAGLAYIHGKGVIHRDISLENVMVGPDGHAVLTDFGVARVNDHELRKRVALTRCTMVELGSGRMKIGKEHYIAPELMRDQMPAHASCESDAYAVGVLVFRLLTGWWFEHERRESARAMLAGMRYDWIPLFERLLNERRNARLPKGGIASIPGLLKVAETRQFGKRALLAAGAAALAIALGAGLWWTHREKPVRTNLSTEDLDDFRQILMLDANHHP